MEKITNGEQKWVLHLELYGYFVDHAKEFCLQQFCLWQNIAQFEEAFGEWLKNKSLYKETYHMESSEYHQLCLWANEFLEVALLNVK